MSINPFSAGRWVCGEHFFGRKALLQNLLEGHESCRWVIGMRRIGKTSLLRQLEKLVNETRPDGFALFWDVQGSFDSEGLFDSLFDAVEDNQDLFPAKWEAIDFEMEETGDSAQSLKKLARALARTGKHLYLLIDESEELMNIGKQNSALLSKLRRFFQTNRNTTIVMISSPTLEQMTAVSSDTSPFLHGFTVSYLGNFTEEETLQLLRRGLPDAACEKIHELTRGNPFETQLLARNYWGEQEMGRTLLELETTPTLNQTIEVNFRLLTEDERTVLKEIHCGTLPFQDFERAITIKLLRLGLLRETAPETYAISSYFQSKWLGSHLLDGQQGSFNSHPGEVIEGIVLKEDSPTSVLKQVVDIYKIFLEVAQQGKRITQLNGKADLPTIDGSRILDAKTVVLLGETRKESPWQLAVMDTATLLESLVSRQETWPLNRLLTMMDGGVSRYTEKDFLDLMMLIAEEAELD